MGRAAMMVLLAIVMAAVAPAQMGGDAEDAGALMPALTDASVHYGKKRAKLGSVQKKLPFTVRVALNRWAPVALDLGMEMAVGKRAEVLVIGTADAKELQQAAVWMDEAAELIAPLDEAKAGADAPKPAPRAMVAFLFDEEGMQSEAWRGLMDAFVTERVLDRSTAASFVSDPSGVTMRHAGIFVQPTFDMAGDAGAGDDEFRLGNEVVGKFTHVLLSQRYGPLPESLRWGIGFVVEQRLFRSIYQFNAAGFVASEDHFEWPKRTRDMLTKRMKDKTFSLADEALEPAGSGRAVPSQMLTWASLDYMLAKKPAALTELLSTLTGLHRAEDEHGMQPSYQGTSESTREAITSAWESVDERKLKSHLKKVK